MCMGSGWGANGGYRQLRRALPSQVLESTKTGNYQERRLPEQYPPSSIGLETREKKSKEAQEGSTRWACFCLSVEVQPVGSKSLPETWGIGPTYTAGG